MTSLTSSRDQDPSGRIRFPQEGGAWPPGPRRRGPAHISRPEVDASEAAGGADTGAGNVIDEEIRRLLVVIVIVVVSLKK